MPGRVRALLAAAAVLAATAGAPASRAQQEPVPQGVEELKRALADLRRRLAEQQGRGSPLAAEGALRAAQRQAERLTAAVAELRRERDGLRRDLLAARAERERLLRADAAARHRLGQAKAEIARLRHTAEAEAEAAAAPARAPALPAAPVAGEPVRVTEVVDGSAFAPGGSELRPEAEPRLAEIAARIRGAPAALVRIVGFTDATGDEAANRRLSVARAEAVRAHLVAALGGGSDGMLVEGRGEAEPVGDNATAAGRAANRRVVVTLEP